MNKTQYYYNKNHKILIERYNSAKLTDVHTLFIQHIQASNKVLDIGFGSGRDLIYIQSLDAECYGVDACQSFVDELSQDEAFREHLFCAKLPILGLDFSIKFDVVVCIAVIMHLTKEEIRLWVEDVKNYLAVGGKVIVSYSLTPRENDERFFEDLRKGVVLDIFLESGFKLIDEVCSGDVLGRRIEWVSGVYKLKT